MDTQCALRSLADDLPRIVFFCNKIAIIGIQSICYRNRGGGGGCSDCVFRESGGNSNTFQPKFLLRWNNRLSFRVCEYSARGCSVHGMAYLIIPPPGGTTHSNIQHTPLA